MNPKEAKHRLFIRRWDLEAREYEIQRFARDQDDYTEEQWAELVTIRDCLREIEHALHEIAEEEYELLPGKDQRTHQESSQAD